MGLASVKNSGNIVDAFSIATILSYYYFLFNNNNSQPKRKKTHKSLSNNKQPKNELIEAIDNTILLKIASSKPLVVNINTGISHANVNTMFGSVAGGYSGGEVETAMVKVTVMDPQQVTDARLRARYERLIGDDIKKVTVLPRRRQIMNKINGRTLKRKGIRLMRARKLNWKAIFGAIIWPKRIAKIYADVVARMKMDGVYPGIGFSCQWGLPNTKPHAMKGKNGSVKKTYANRIKADAGSGVPFNNLYIDRGISGPISSFNLWYPLSILGKLLFQNTKPYAMKGKNGGVKKTYAKSN
ncbi:hypothetical protein LguiA_008330 [Lonicera macranthoides]